MSAIIDHHRSVVRRTVVSTVAAVIALGGGLLATQPAGAAVSQQSSEASSTSASEADVHSVGHPKAAAKYADEFISAWAADARDDLNKRATPSALEALNEHGRANVKEWKRIAADGDAEKSTVVYSNRVTGALLVVHVDNRAADDKADHAVRSVRLTR
ncbi:hypothetical protein [Brevibacterium pigmentatum]|uniref:hypothetical protein n=1 Tax=Brevibacterium pigmentatum TaxID=1496080 RepID=UPI001423E171|nr:hypothetical protein [Brevibacterium pigmentatum]